MYAKTLHGTILIPIFKRFKKIVDKVGFAVYAWLFESEHVGKFGYTASAMRKTNS